jgi:hypothetical protein
VLTWLLVLLKLAVTLPLTRTDRLSLPPSFAVLRCALTTPDRERT